ncbi:MAG: ATPase [Chloroflexota bacterium]
MTLEPWELFGSAVVEAEALVRRMTSGPPRDLAGLVIEDEEVDRLLAELPGMGGAFDADVRDRTGVEGALAQLRLQFHESLGDASPFSTLVRRAALTPAEAEVLALLAGIERSPARQRLLAYAQDDVSATRPWLSSLNRMFPPGHPGAAAVAPDARLRRAELVTVTGESAWATRVVALAERVTWALAGDHSADPGLPPAAERLEVYGAPADTGGTFLLVHGADRQSRRIRVAHELGRRFLATPIPADDAGWRALVREATVAGGAIVLEVDEPLLPAPAAAWAVRADHLDWAICSPNPLEIRTIPARPWREVELTKRLATPEEWEATFGQRPAHGHRLDPDELRLARIAHEGVEGDLDAAVRRLASGQLAGLGIRIHSRRTWESLILPTHQQRQLQELVARYRHSSTVFDEWGFRPVGAGGLVALFAGPSGTGKTLAAEVMGAALGLDVYKIDLSSIVSKYIGETEKNLERIFQAASAGNVVLFFDEADALFGKRSEVSDAHDRYANIEVAYLLQRIEAYEGLVVLATNLRANMDEAFLRRIHVSVEFREPDERERLRIWQLAFPAGAPTEDLDLPWLARQFRLTGGVIHNAAITAAFLAAEEGRAISMQHAVLGVDREMEKLGRLRTENDFGPYYRFVSSNG